MGNLLVSSPMASENVVELNDSNFDSVISAATEPVLVDFWAPSRPWPELDSLKIRFFCSRRRESLPVGAPIL